MLKRKKEWRWYLIPNKKPNPRKRSSKGKGKSGGGSNYGRKRLITPPGEKKTAPMFDIGSLDHLSFEGYSALGNTVRYRLFYGTGILYIDDGGANETAFKALITSVIRAHMSISGMDKYDATFEDYYLELVMACVKLIGELKAQLSLLYFHPEQTRSDSTAGYCFTRASLEALLSAMEKTDNLSIPGIAMAIVNFISIPIQIQGAIPNEGKRAVYFFPYRPYLQLTEVETLVNTILGLQRGLIHGNRNKLPSIKFSRALVQPSMPVRINSTHGMVFVNYFTARDDAATTQIEIDETSEVYYFQDFGVGESFDALVLLRTDAHADDPAFFTINAPAAGKLNINYFTEGDATHNALPDTSKVMDWLCAVAANQSRSPIVRGDTPTGMGVIQIDNRISSPTGWDNRLIGYLTRHISGSAPDIRGLPLLPDTIYRDGRKSIFNGNYEGFVGGDPNAQNNQNYQPR